MDQRETAQLLNAIQNLYPNFKLNQQILDAWTNALLHTDKAVAHRLLEGHFKTSKYPPHPSDLINDTPVNYAQLEYEQLEREAENSKNQVRNEDIDRQISERLNRIREVIKHGL